MFIVFIHYDAICLCDVFCISFNIQLVLGIVQQYIVLYSIQIPTVLKELTLSLSSL